MFPDKTLYHEFPHSEVLFFLIFEDSDERSVAIAVRIHKTLELADDKYYMITCGRAGFQNLQNKTSLVTLQLLREGRKVEQVVYGREYMLR